MITIDIEKAKGIAHDRRRTARAAEFAPLDQRIAAAIPGDDRDALEADRQAIRDRYAEMQAQIDEAGDPAALARLVSDLT